MGYEQLSAFAQTGGMIYFSAIFVVVCIWVFRPKNQATYQNAASIALRSDQDLVLDPMEAPYAGDNKPSGNMPSDNMPSDNMEGSTNDQA